LQEETLINQTIQDNTSYIKAETLADTLEVVQEVKDGLEISFDNIKTFLSISKI